MKIIFYLHLLLLVVLTSVQAQESNQFLRDSIYGDRGISGTTDFEPETRIHFPSYDEQGRVLEQVRERIDAGGVWRPQSRRMFTYEGDQLTQMHIQLWSVNNSIWLDQRKDMYRYENGLRIEFIRQKAPQGQLENERRRQYSYNANDQETGVLLQQWNGSGWENLSRKIVDYNENNDLSRQVLQVWMNGDWRNVRSREWEYETAGPRSRVKATLVRIWSVTENDWIDQLRKIFQYNNDGLWVSSRFEEWRAEPQEWIKTDRMIYAYNEQNQPIGQSLQVWDGDWENRGQVNYTFKDNQFLSKIETWNKADGAWTNFLRYQVNLDDRNLLASRIGMQAWDSDQMVWENRNFTQRFTYFWSEKIVNSVKEAIDYSACVVPNPYPSGHYFFCDLPPAKQNYQLELYDALGRPVYRMNFQSGQAVAIDQRPPPGMYVLRIHAQQQLHHVQRLIIH